MLNGLLYHCLQQLPIDGQEEYGRTTVYRNQPSACSGRVADLHISTLLVPHPRPIKNTAIKLVRKGNDLVWERETRH